MIGPQTLLRAELALREREQEVEAAERRARLLAGMPERHRWLLEAAESWLRAVAASLFQPASEPQCCLQLA